MQAFALAVLLRSLFLSITIMVLQLKRIPLCEPLYVASTTLKTLPHGCIMISTDVAISTSPMVYEYQSMIVTTVLLFEG